MKKDLFDQLGDAFMPPDQEIKKLKEEIKKLKSLYEKLVENMQKVSTGTSHIVENRDNKIKKLREANKEYIDLLEAELQELAALAQMQGWKSTRIKQGRVASGKIEALKE